MKDESTLVELKSSLTLDDEFDPLEDFEPDEADEEGVTGYVGTREAAETPQLVVDERPAEVRIDELLKKMAPQRKTLLETIAFCKNPQSVASVNVLIDEMQADNFSVFSPATLCDLLEKAGALIKVTADGEPADEREAEPQTVVIDGVEYLEASDPVEVYWLSTEESSAAVEADKPLERLQMLFEEDSTYLPIYKRILTLCAQEGGASTPEINSQVDADPLVQSPRLYAPHFVDKLEKCDALIWKKAWITTEVGQAALESLTHGEEDESTTEREEA